MKAVAPLPSFLRLAALTVTAILAMGAIEGAKMNTDLRTQLSQRDALLTELRARGAAPEAELPTIQSALALSSEGPSGHRTSIQSPSSTLDWASAVHAAMAAKLMVQGSSLLTVMPTGSMEPTFNERAILLMEPARFEDLKVGDVVTYKHPKYGMVVVHRIVEKHGDNFWSKGDNNGRMDQVYITRQNYGARVFGIIYARESSQASRRSVQDLGSDGILPPESTRSTLPGE